MSTAISPKANKQQKGSTGYYLNCIITVVIMVGFGYLPSLEPITHLGMQVVGIFIGLIYGWTTVGLIWPSVLGMILLGLTEYGTINQILIEGFGSNIVVLCLFIFIFAAVVSASGVSNFIAMWFVTRPIFFGKPWVFSFVFLFVAYLLSATVNTIAAIIICWGILYDICKALGYKAGDKYPAVMVLGITVFCTLGMGAFPYKLIPLLVLGAFQKMGGEAVNYFSFVCLYWSLTLLGMMGFLLLCKLVFRVDASAIKQMTRETFGEVDLTLKPKQKVILGFLVTLIVLLLSPSLLPKTFFLTIFLTKIGAVGTVMLIVTIMICVRIDKEPLIDFSKLAREGIQWDPLILTAAALPVSSALTVDETGIKAFLIQSLGPLFLEKSVIVFAILSIGLALLITNFANNGMTALIFMPVIVSFSTSLNANPMVMTILLIYCVHVAIMTPAACPMAAMMHGNKDWINTKQIYSYGGLTVLMMLVIILFVGIPLGNILF